MHGRPYGYKPTPKTLEEIRGEMASADIKQAALERLSERIAFLEGRVDSLIDAHMYLTQQYESLRSHVLYGTPMPHLIPGVQ